MFRQHCCAAGEAQGPSTTLASLRFGRDDRAVEDDKKRGASGSGSHLSKSAKGGAPSFFHSPQPRILAVRDGQLVDDFFVFRGGVAAEKLREVLRERGARQDHVAADFVGFLL